MKQPEEVFKVVKIEGDKYLSALEAGTNQLEYKPNKTTKPKLGKIFAFSSIEHARLFIKENLDPHWCEIWKAKGKNPKEINKICKDPSKDEEFWRGLITNNAYIGQSPKGTLVVEEIKLVEKIEQKNS